MITVILMLILAGVVVNLAFGNNGLIKKAEEAKFKTRISAMQETGNLYCSWQVTLKRETDTSWMNAGIMLQDMINQEIIDIKKEDISFSIEDVISDISRNEKNYVAIYKGMFYYVSNDKTKNNSQQVKWCREIGIPILEYKTANGITVVNGNYELVKGLYLCTPKLNDGFIKEKTRYLNIDNKGNLVPGNWITDKASDDWYDYKNNKWANIYVENNGVECYYTWIPRYAFKLDQATQTSDVKFIDVKDNSYIEVKEDGSEIKHDWNELKDEYQIPEAFSWVDDKGNTVPLAGYWVSKYTLGDISSYVLSYNMTSNIGSITVQDFVVNSSVTPTSYTYALNGIIKETFTEAKEYEFTNLKAGDNVVNVTALDENGEILGSMTKVYSPAIVNEPDLTGFNKDTTFYVTWDKNGVEHSEIPIRKDPPAMWYEYGARMWANIVTRNNGQETYYTWIPRYEFSLDQLSQTSTVRFIKGTSSQTSGTSYQIPEAFSWTKEENGETITVPLTGYWVSKYTLGDEMAPRFDTEITATSNSITTRKITGSAVAEGQKYMYYIDGDYKETRKYGEDPYEYTSLAPGKKYTINIIVRNSETEEYLGSITKQITTVQPNKPDLTGFNPDVTYYVTYDNDGNEVIGDKIQNDGKNAPSNWYNYSGNKNIWANIVVKTENATTYYTWIPRYEFKILSGQYLNSNQRTEVRFLEGISSRTSGEGYQIPEAFNWTKEENGENVTVPLTGYWVSKYTLGEQTY